jgi:hypothetical protein
VEQQQQRLLLCAHSWLAVGLQLRESDRPCAPATPHAVCGRACSSGGSGVRTHLGLLTWVPG